ncbi:hypothetical protein [Dysgonomonas sp. 520]|uniref:hypothetical protein n=1 Tax=Dysgonomonas sp. 520 TaxID=2302931 RepID=UPI0013D4D9E3|nr:hypothetical protein [Dysgonomonas sp. 520]NDW10353.1 hypothetical protein [Dysgonomonas sp. 520]
MKIVYICFMLFCLSVVSVNAQVGINNESPHASSALDMAKDGNRSGVLLPRMTTAQKLAIVKPAHSLLVYDTDKNCVSQNIGTETAPVWDCLTLFNRQFFYMPSINIPTGKLGAATLDLFAEYQSQFSTPMYRSVGASASMGNFSASDLYYYITYYDPVLITVNSISATGVMSYTVLKQANKDAYMNIVFVVK